MRKHDENAQKVAHWLRGHEKVKKVYYVGFEDHPGYEVNRKQSTGFGGMISFTLDRPETVRKLLSGGNMIADMNLYGVAGGGCCADQSGISGRIALSQSD